MMEELQLLTRHIEMAEKLHQCLEELQQNEKRIEAQIKVTEIRLGIHALTDEERRLWELKIEGLRPDQILWLLMCLQDSKSTLAAFLEDTRNPQPGLLTQLINEVLRQVRSEIHNN